MLKFIQMKISFDFDGTLSENKPIQILAESVVSNEDIEIFILTHRAAISPFMDNSDVYKWADKLKIPKENIIFADHDNKYKFIEKYNIDIHFDDDYNEICDINEMIESQPGVYIGGTYGKIMSMVIRGNNES